ncbi:linear amide C-N hydrolase, partial [bacterium]|nr:linear amide C-N hydrolase [bacterium]
MLNRRLVYLALPIILSVMNEYVVACTVYSATRGGKILAAKNMDWDNLDSRILFIPPSSGKYGRVYVGLEVPEGFCNTSGMNDQGLWYAGASLPERTDVRNHYNKPRIQGELVERAMEECATVEEVIELFTEYWEPWWDGHSMFADRHGNSVVIEFGDKDVVFIRRQSEYQVMTNFYLADSANARWYNCYRYKMADYMLKNSDDISIELFRSVADAVHQEGFNPTILTTIHDLKSGEIYIYNFFNYEELVRFNLQEELEKGEGYYALPELFNQVRLRAPAPAEVVYATSVTFEW